MNALLLRALPAFCLMMMLAACATSSQRPTLPLPPVEFGLPVDPPVIRDGDDARLVLGRAAQALRKANRRLNDDRAFYDDVQKGFNAP